ncbi:MAG: DUF6036 family nucleotidyltransferase [Thermodesulfobacteriota bacterium]
MFQLDFEKIIELLKEFTEDKKEPLEVILIGGLALHYYGMKNRATIDIDAEVKGDIDGLFNFLKSKRIPSDIGENISGWSVISMPSFYRERTIVIYKDGLLTVKVLHPSDFIIAKLRRFTDEDLEDAVFVAKKFDLSQKDVKESANSAVENSPADTAIFIFRKNVELFLTHLS